MAKAGRRRVLRRTLAAWVAAGAALIIAAPSALAGSAEFKFGGNGTWTVPDDVTEITIEVAGGGGGATRTDRGGHGALVIVEVEVTPGETFSIGVGGGGGGRGSNTLGAGGGGASIVQGPDLGADRVADRLLVIAGGGGGAGLSSSENRRGGDAGRNNAGAGQSGRGLWGANGASGNGAGAINNVHPGNTGDGLAFDPSITFDPANPTDNGAGGGRSQDSNPNRALVGGAGSSGGSSDRGGLGGAGYGGGAAAGQSGTNSSFAGGAGGSIGQGAGVTSVTYSTSGGQGGTTDKRDGNDGWVIIRWISPSIPDPVPDPEPVPDPDAPDITGSDDQSVAASVRQQPAPVALALAMPSGMTCTPLNDVMHGAWIRVPAAQECSDQTFQRSGSGALLGWATTPDFPVDIAQRQIDNGWGAYELTNNNGRVTSVFIPAGGWTKASASNNLFPIWAQN